jgi:hypothetical protein
MRGFRPGLCGLTVLMLAAGACTAAETDTVALSGNTAMSDDTPATDQDAGTLGPDTVSGFWALSASDRTDEKGCRIALQKTGQDGIYGVYLQGCQGTVLARVAGWRVLDDSVAVLDAGGEPILRFRRAGPDLLEARSGGVTYRLEPAAMM